MRLLFLLFLIFIASYSFAQQNESLSINRMDTVGVENDSILLATLRAESIRIEKDFQDFLSKKDNQIKYELLVSIGNGSKKLLKSDSMKFQLLEFKKQDSLCQVLHKKLSSSISKVDSIKSIVHRDSMKLANLEKENREYVNSDEYKKIKEDEKLLFPTSPNQPIVTIPVSSVIDDQYVQNYLSNPFNQNELQKIINSGYQGHLKNAANSYCLETKEAIRLLNIMNEAPRNEATLLYEYGINEKVKRMRSQGYIYLANQFETKYQDMKKGIHNADIIYISIPPDCN